MGNKASKVKRREVKKLKATAKRLRRSLERTESDSARWKRKAKARKAEMSRLNAQVDRLKAEVDRLAKEALERTRQLKQLGKQQAAEAPDLPPPPAETSVASAPVGLPDSTWTVTRLRRAAREAGVPGSSRMAKAALIEELTTTS